MMFKWNTPIDTQIACDITKLKINNDRVRMSMLVDYETYKEIYVNELFNLYRESIGKNFKEEFDKNNVIEIELVLDPSYNEILEGAVKFDSESIIQFLLKKSVDENNIFLSTDSWYVLNVKQEEELPDELKELGSLKVGFDTRWKEELINNTRVF